MTTGIPVGNLNDYIEVLKSTLKLNDDFCNMLKTMAYASSKDKLVCEVKCETEFESNYGYIAMIKDADKSSISCVYAFHNMKFKLVDRRIENRTQKKFLFIPVGEEVVSVEHQVNNSIKLSVTISVTRFGKNRHFDKSLWPFLKGFSKGKIDISNLLFYD